MFIILHKKDDSNNMKHLVQRYLFLILELFLYFSANKNFIFICIFFFHATLRKVSPAVPRKPLGEYDISVHIFP